MEPKKSGLIYLSKALSIQFRQERITLTLGFVIFGSTRNVIWLSAFSTRLKLSAELLLVTISSLRRSLLLCTSLLFGFWLNNTILGTFQIRSRLKFVLANIIKNVETICIKHSLIFLFILIKYNRLCKSNIMGYWLLWLFHLKM